jgi:tetratricopeptide (TPR) repeat protein
MKKETREEHRARFKLLHSDPVRYVEVMNEVVNGDPTDPFGYHARHHGWIELGQLDRAEADLDKVLELEPSLYYFDCRGRFFMKFGRWRDALSDFASAEALNPEGWRWKWGTLYQAHCYSRLGDHAAALAACNDLPNDYDSWPGLDGTPRGTKEEIIAEFHRRAGAAKKSR